MYNTLKLVLKEFLSEYPYHFLFLFIILVIEGLIVALSVVSLIPLADYLIDSNLANPSVITKKIILILNFFNLKASLSLFLFLFIFLNIFKSIVSTIMTYTVLKIKYSVFKKLTKDVLEDFFNARWQFFSNTNHGKLLNTINSQISRVGSSLGDFTMQLATVVKFITYIITPFILNAKITSITITIAIIFIFPFFLLNKLGYSYGKKDVETSNVLTSVFNETLQAAKLIIGYGRQIFSIEKNIKALNDHINVTLKSQILQTLIVNSFQPISFLAASISLVIVYNSQDSLSELAAVFWSLLAALPLLTSILRGNYDISNFLPSYEQLSDLRKKSQVLKEQHGELIFNKLENEIILSDINFAYPSRNYNLSIDNLKIKKGKVTAIIGESGAGKSSLIDLILGFNIPNSGQITIDGRLLSDYNKNSFRSKIGYVPQESFLFNATVRENLLWAKENSSEDDIINALNLANAYKFINDMPKGIDTIVGDRGMKLSGGQKQRISLARALLRNPEILILDEATSSLDSESEKLIQKSIDDISKFITIIIIAHRLSTVKKADQIIILKDGIIIEKGKTEILTSNKKSLFNQMLDMQKLDI